MKYSVPSNTGSEKDPPVNLLDRIQNNKKHSLPKLSHTFFPHPTLIVGGMTLLDYHASSQGWRIDVLAPILKIFSLFFSEWIQNGEKHNGESYKMAKTKRRNYKTAKLQNSEHTKRRILQNGKYYKMAT